jgi:Replication initiator protein, pSAM2
VSSGTGPDLCLCFPAITRRAFSYRCLLSLWVTFALFHPFLTREIELGVTRRTRAERLIMPLARDVVKDLAVEHGACIRPVQRRRTNLDTGTVGQVLVPCGHTLASVCPACAQRAKTLRAAQCPEGWHLEAEPVIDPDPATEEQSSGSKSAPRPRLSATRPGQGHRKARLTTWTGWPPS